MADAQSVSFGKRLRQERQKSHWTQEQLAEKIGISVRSINRWEHDMAIPRQHLLALLTEVFGRPPERWGTTGQIYWNVPFSRNPYFTGREQVLQRLHQALAVDQIVALSQISAISGLGGIGKTQTAIEYAYRFAHEYEAVLWVNADSSDSLVSDFAALAAVLGLSAQLERDQYNVVSAVKRWLKDHGPWLLIFDNADDPSLVSDFLPSRTGGATLLTTRSQATGPHFEKIEMEKISREEGIDFLLLRVHAAEVSQHEREAAGQLWESVDGLPLALDQVAAYIEETGCTFNDYLVLFKTRRAQLLNRRGLGASALPESVATTWLLAFENVELASPAAADLLRLCAFLHPDEIPETMLIAGADALGPVLQSIAANALAWNEAIGELRKYSLLKRDAEKKLLNMHRLVQAMITDNMYSGTLWEWAVRAMLVVNAAFPDAEQSSWQQCELLLPHALLVARYIEEYHIISEEAGRLLHETATYLRDRARYSDAEPLYQRALDIRKQQLGPEHLDVAASLNGLAILYREQGKYAEAEPLYQRALRILEQELGPEHPQVASSLYDLAILYSIQGKYAEAEPLYQRALAITMRAYGEEHPGLAAGLTNLAFVYYDQGKYAEAVPAFQRVLHIREQQLGLEHPDVARALSNLAELFTKLGEYAEAEPLFHRALRIWSQQMEPRHPEGAITLDGLANLYREQSKYAEAEPLYQRALRILEQELGPEHPQTASIMHDLARLWEAKGSREEASTWYTRALAIQEQTLGTGHPKTTETRSRLMALINALGQPGGVQEEALVASVRERKDESNTSTDSDDIQPAYISELRADSSEERVGEIETEEAQFSLFAVARATLEDDDQILVDKAYTIEAGISQSKPEDFEGEPFDLHASNKTETLLFEIIFHKSKKIQLTTDWQKSLLYILSDQRPQTVEFTFYVTAPGSSSVDINFYYKQRWLRTLHFEFDAVEQQRTVKSVAEG